MKKIFCCIVAVLLLATYISVAASAATTPATAQVSVTSSVACPGKPIVVNVQLAATGIQTLDVTLTYNANVMSISGSPIYGTLGGLNVSYNVPTPGRIKIICDALDNVTVTGNLITLNFVLADNAAVGEYGIDVSVMAATVEQTYATVTPISGKVTVAHTPEADDGDCRTAVKCSTCGAVITDAKADHVDNDNNGKCDNCGQDVSNPTPPTPPTPPACSHMAASRVIVANAATCNTTGNGFTMIYCTLCGQTLSTYPMTIPATNAHVDEDKDHKCDTCANVISECADEDKDHKCDVCGDVITQCADEDKDGKCDTCGADVVVEHVHELEYTAAKEATCFEEGNLEYWYCAGCDCYFTDAEGKYNIARLSLITPVAHKVEHVEAKEATCFETGNIEYWYCTECGYAWLDELCTKNTNLKAVILPVTHKVEHVAAVAPTCFETGNIEYWYCTECGYAWLDELCTKNTNLKAVILPVSHKIEYVAAVAPTATENGNIEYWYCTECGYAWLDELCTKNTNLKAVILPATGEIVSPDTGDVAIFCAVALAVIATLGVAVVSYKKREEN